MVSFCWQLPRSLLVGWTIIPSSPLVLCAPLGVEASCCVVLVPSPFALGELSVMVSVSVSPSRSVLVCSPAFPCSRQFSPVCQYVQAQPMILFDPVQCLRRRIVLLACSPGYSPSPVAGPLLPVVFPQFVFLVFSQPSAFSCCSPSSKCPSFDSQYLQLVAAPPTTSSPSYVWWSHPSVSSCFSPRTSFGPISFLSSASLPCCLLPLSVVSVCPPAHSRSPVASSWLPVILPV